MALTRVDTGLQSFPDFSRNQQLASAQIYVGIPGLDPSVLANQYQAYVVQEDGTQVAVSQPIETSAGGIPTYMGSPVQIAVAESAYSLKVLNSIGSQIYYQPDNTDLSLISADQVSYTPGGTGAVATTVQNKLREEVHVFDYMSDTDIDDALAGTLTDATTAFTNAYNHVRSGGTIRIDGLLPIDPFTSTKPLRILGNAMRQTVTWGGTIGARGNQTHILMFKGGVGTFPTDFLDGVSLENVAFYGANNTISDAGLIFWNAGNGNCPFLNIANCVGSAIRFKNAQDLHFVSAHISDVGDNVNQKSVLYLDPTSNNNVNNIYFVDPHFESVGWTILESSNASDDQIQLIGGKCENRINYAGQTATDLAFPLFDITSSNRFSCDGLTLTNAHLYSEPTYKLNGASRPHVVDINVQNSSNQTSPLVKLIGSCQGYFVDGITGSNVGPIVNESTGQGKCQPEVINIAGSNYSNMPEVVGLTQLPDYWTRNAGGTYAIGLANSIFGRSLDLTTQNDAIPSIKLPTGYQKPIAVVWRVQSSASITVSMATRLRDNTGNVAIRTGVSVTSGSWQHIRMYLTVTQLATADVAVLYKETAGADHLYVDGVWIEPDVTEIERPVLTVTSSGTQVGEAHNAATFFIRSVSHAGSAIVTSDTNFGLTIVSQSGTTFVTGAPGAGQVRITQTASGGKQILTLTSNSATSVVGLQQITAN